MSLNFKLLLDRYLGGLLIVLLNGVARSLGLTLRRDHALRVRGDILVIKMLGGGSLVMAMPALLGIRRAYPDIKIRLFTTGAVKPFAVTLGIFDEILLLDDSSLPRMIVSGLRHLLTACGSDTVIDLEVYSYLSAVISLFTFARNRIGFFYEESGLRQRLHTHKIFFHLGSPLYLHYDRIAKILGGRIASMEDCAALIRRTIGADPASKASANGSIAIGCGCSELSRERQLEPQQWSRAIFTAAPDRQREVLFLGAMHDHAEAEKIIAAVKRAGPESWAGPLRNLCGVISLQDALLTLARCDEYWGIDSSLLHYARLFGIKVKAFFGPSDPATRLRPIAGLQEHIFYRKTLCSPCIHLLSIPPCHGDNLCMQWLFDPAAANDPRAGWTPVLTDNRPKDMNEMDYNKRL